MKNVLLALSVALNLALAALFLTDRDRPAPQPASQEAPTDHALAEQRATEMLKGLLKQSRERRYTFMESYPANTANVVLFGDSIVEGGEWAYMFGDLSIRNFGRGGDTVETALERVDQLVAAQPSAVFINLGTNDINEFVEPARSHKAMREIVARLREESPQTDVYIQSVLPKASNQRAALEAYNSEMQRIADEYGVTYLDFYAPFLGDNGAIDRRYSNDDLHLHGAGYALWLSLLRPHVEPYLAGDQVGLNTTTTTP